MGKKSIKIVIAGRSYPLNIQEEEEEFVQQAVQSINSQVKQLQESYAVKDMQDLLAMASLQLATKMVVNSATVTQNESANKEEIVKALQTLSNAIDLNF